MYNKGKQFENQFFIYMSPNVKKYVYFGLFGGPWGGGGVFNDQTGPIYKMCIFGYSDGPGWPINNRTGPILLPSCPLTYINLHIKYGSNPIRMFSRYRVNDEMSVDAAAKRRLSHGIPRVHSYGGYN